MKPRLLVLVVAYHAEETLRRVLQGIPEAVFSTFEAEILVVDDASEDRTFEIGREYRAEHPHLPVTVLRNEFNQGHGGNQKVGFSFAIRRGFDHVAVLPGDGRYAPGDLLEILTPLVAGTADAVFATRAGAGERAYRSRGDALLSAFQNLLLGTKLSDFYSGYRSYSVKTLARVPFDLNSNELHFDTEIIIQFLNAGARIIERPVSAQRRQVPPPRSRSRHVTSTVRTTLQSVLHQTGLLYQRRFDTEPQDNTIYALKLGYPSSYTMVLDRIPHGSCVLDIGSGPGEMAREIVKRGSTVTIVDRDVRAAGTGVNVIEQDLDDPIHFSVDGHSHILLLDIIEHLKSPERFLEELRRQFTYDPRTLIVTSPNVAFVVQRLMLLFGQFNYGKRGILDRTHTRLFTFRSLQRLLRDTGFRIKSVKGIPAPFPKVFGDGVVGRGAVRLNLALIGMSRSLFSYQILIEAETTPDVAFVLGNTLHASTDEAVESKRLTRSPPPSAQVEEPVPRNAGGSRTSR
ncbi:MAG TPA: bifunctional glycosyltransferase/class I SAM-dependent methyltransferase [Polyangiaceae bacterium]|jgi:glycosyltransferase involved in cell wall biosynthesis|nr:bifunctional glycosyltransferase/class I SAM-dependent methyltransferase [Polyangiaceae bacterium]